MEESNIKLRLLINLDEKVLEPFKLLWEDIGRKHTQTPELKVGENNEKYIKKCDELSEFLEKERDNINTFFGNSLWEIYRCILSEEKKLFAKLNEDLVGSFNALYWILHGCINVQKGDPNIRSQITQTVDRQKIFVNTILDELDKTLFNEILSSYASWEGCIEIHGQLKDYAECLPEAAHFIYSYLSKCGEYMKNCPYRKIKLENLKLK
jgi:hypothetical protein